MGCDERHFSCRVVDQIFQSTHPVWGATVHDELVALGFINFNPRTPCGVRRDSGADGKFTVKISIHAPRVGCDTLFCLGVGLLPVFQSTHPVWGATETMVGTFWTMVDFNPRTPCGVRLWAEPLDLPGILNFNPRTPCGVRLVPDAKSQPDIQFQSTHPVWGATRCASRRNRS